MSDIEGVYSIQVMSLDELVSGERLTFNKEGHWIEFGIRWEDGEIANDILVVDEDGHAELEDEMTWDQKTYFLEFGEDLVDHVLKVNLRLPENVRPANSIALRYAVEFDGYLDPQVGDVGGKFVWGGGRGREERREPDDFAAAWKLS